jgi:hypothetical protein
VAKHDFHIISLLPYRARVKSQNQHATPSLPSFNGDYSFAVGEFASVDRRKQTKTEDINDVPALVFTSDDTATGLANTVTIVVAGGGGGKEVVNIDYAMKLATKAYAAAAHGGVTSTSYTLYVADTPLVVVVHERKIDSGAAAAAGRGVVFFNMHDTENDTKEAALSFITSAYFARAFMREAFFRVVLFTQL